MISKFLAPSKCSRFLLVLRTFSGVETNPVNAFGFLHGHSSIPGFLRLHGIPEGCSTEGETQRANAQYSILSSLIAVKSQATSFEHHCTGISQLKGLPTGPMSSIGQQTALVAAQQELLKLKGSGRQLLEALAEADDRDGRAQKVILLLNSTCSRKYVSVNGSQLCPWL